MKEAEVRLELVRTMLTHRPPERAEDLVADAKVLAAFVLASAEAPPPLPQRQPQLDDLTAAQRLAVCQVSLVLTRAGFTLADDFFAGLRGLLQAKAPLSSSCPTSA